MYERLSSPCRFNSLSVSLLTLACGHQTVRVPDLMNTILECSRFASRWSCDGSIGKCCLDESKPVAAIEMSDCDIPIADSPM